MKNETRLVPAQSESALMQKETAAPVPVGVDEVATTIVAALDFVAALIPDLRKPHPRTAKKVRGARTVSREAVRSILAMVETSPRVKKLSKMDTERTQEVLSSADDYRVLGERFEVISAQVKYTAEARWAEVVSVAMKALGVATILAKEPGEEELAAQVATIRRHLGRRNAATGKRKKKTE